MQRTDFAWMIGGPQGSGINSVAETFGKACARGGLHVFANIEYHSNIKGEHSYYRVRVSDHEIRSYINEVHLLIALDRETIFGDVHKAYPSHEGHRHEVAAGGGIIYDTDLKLTAEQVGRPDIRLLPVPYKTLLVEVLKEVGKDKELSRYQVMVNTVAFGASMGMLNFDFNLAASVIKESFTGRKAPLGDLNIKAARAGYDYAVKNLRPEPEYKLQTRSGQEKRMLIRGVAAVGMAKLKAGCAFQTYYPITPASDESEYLESHEGSYNILVVQNEDEISAVLMAAGAAHAGVRASTSTSGPGFSLMAEGLGWAGITEAPGPVIILWQRAGPSTGLPTRQEQGDLRFVLHASHGEFPRIVIAPGSVVECFYDTFDAFNYAEKYQVPVIVLTDKFLASSYKTERFFDTSALKIDRGRILTKEELKKIASYKRYEFTEMDVSPRTVPGEEGGIFWTTGDEHDQFGHINENADNRSKMMRKRMRKLELAAEMIPPEKKLKLYGSESVDATIVSWGSTQGAILDTIDELKQNGYTINFLQVRYMSPFPKEEIRRILGNAKLKILVENNYSGQLGGLIMEHTGISMDERVLKYDGRPFSLNEVRDNVSRILKNHKN